MPDFVTADPRTSGRQGSVGALVYYVAGGAATQLYKYGTSATAWCAPPPEGAASPVTADPRTGGLDRPVGSTVMYVSGGVGLALHKYGPAPTAWCTWQTPPNPLTVAALALKAASAHTHVTGDTTGLDAAIADKADAWHSHAVFDTVTAGMVPASGGSPTKFLRADGQWTDPPAGGGGGVSGVVVVDFGPFPGKTDASVQITEQANVVSTSAVIARVRGAATADHSADEHWVEGIDVFAGDIVEGEAFTIYARSTDKQRRHGQWSVGWSY